MAFHFSSVFLALVSTNVSILFIGGIEEESYEEINNNSAGTFVTT